jgi:hypothetical protein
MPPKIPPIGASWQYRFLDVRKQKSPENTWLSGLLNGFLNGKKPNFGGNEVIQINP